MPALADLPDTGSLPSDDTDLEYEDDLTDEEWDEIVAEIDQEDARGEKPVFNSGDYPSHEEAMAALKARMDGIVKEVLDEIAATAASDAKGRPRLR